MDRFNREELKYQKVDPSGVDIVLDWLQKPHVKEFWGDGGMTISDLKVFVWGKPSVFTHFFGYYRHTPIVYIMQSILEEGHPWDCWKEPGKNVSVDIMIGDEHFVGKGLGHIILDAFIEETCQDARAVLVDPELRHEQAIHVYKKAGFVPQGIYRPERGGWAGVDHMILKRVQPVEEPLITVRSYDEQDAGELAKIYYYTIHNINSRDYTKEQLDVWAPETSLQTEGWLKKFQRTNPFVATANGKVVGFAEFERNGHIDCFYCHHDWIGKGVGSALLTRIYEEAVEYNLDKIFAEVSITAKPFFERNGFKVIRKQEVARKGVKLVNFQMEKWMKK